MSGKSSGTLAELTSLLRRCRRWDNRFVLGESAFDFWLAREDADALDAIDALRERPLNSLLVLDSELPSTYDGGLSLEENDGGEMISCVCVSERMNVKTGASSSTDVSASGLSFFLSKSLKGILSYRLEIGELVEML
jgi:hypothetical protein